MEKKNIAKMFVYEEGMYRMVDDQMGILGKYRIGDKGKLWPQEYIYLLSVGGSEREELEQAYSRVETTDHVLFYCSLRKKGKLCRILTNHHYLVYDNVEQYHTHTNPTHVILSRPESPLLSIFSQSEPFTLSIINNRQYCSYDVGG